MILHISKSNFPTFLNYFFPPLSIFELRVCISEHHRPLHLFPLTFGLSPPFNIQAASCRILLSWGQPLERLFKILKYNLPPACSHHKQLKNKKKSEQDNDLTLSREISQKRKSKEGLQEEGNNCTGAEGLWESRTAPQMWRWSTKAAYQKHNTKKDIFCPAE